MYWTESYVTIEVDYPSQRADKIEWDIKQTIKTRLIERVQY